MPKSKTLAWKGMPRRLKNSFSSGGLEVFRSRANLSALKARKSSATASTVGTRALRDKKNAVAAATTSMIDAARKNGLDLQKARVGRRSSSSKVRVTRATSSGD